MSAFHTRPFGIPAVTDPEAYVGLYVYDFKTHVSIGYTYSEIAYLRESSAYRGGSAYEIYRATEGGGFELRGATDQRLSAKEAMCFLRRHPAKARGDYDALRDAASRQPLPCPVEMRLAVARVFDPPNMTALIYAAAASNSVSGWLGRVGFHGGDRVVGGVDLCAELLSSENTRIDACDLPTMMRYCDRSAEEVFRTVNKPLQR
ncbi:MAG: hypothetical protein ACE5HE_06990 [Phycisphaerae bacterium]